MGRVRMCLLHKAFYVYRDIVATVHTLDGIKRLFVFSSMGISIYKRSTSWARKLMHCFKGLLEYSHTYLLSPCFKFGAHAMEFWSLKAYHMIVCHSSIMGFERSSDPSSLRCTIISLRCTVRPE